MVDYSQFLDDLGKNLSSKGFSITRSVLTGRYPVEIMAAKGELSALKGNRAHYIVVTTMDLPSPETVTEFSQAAWAYSLANSRVYLPNFPAGIGRGVYKVVVPVVVSQNFTDEMKDWISKKNPAKHTAPFNAPVLMSSSSREIYFCKKIPFISSLAWRGVRKFVEETLDLSRETPSASGFF
jgi:hypothetical protein